MAPSVTALLTAEEMLEAASSIVDYFHYPCSVVITGGHRVSVCDAKKLMTKMFTLVARKEENITALENRQCARFYVAKAEVGAGLGAGPSYWLGEGGEARAGELSLPLHSQFYLLQRRAAVYHLLEVYDVEEGGGRVVGEVGVWHPATKQLTITTSDRSA
jgi:hypothetical protein